MGGIVIFKSVLSGAIVGYVLGLIGGGGSILAVPLLLYFVGYRQDPHIVIGTTALAVGVNALLALLPHLGRRNVAIGPGLFFALFGVLGAAIGAHLGLMVGGRQLLLLFAGIMGVVAVLMWRKGAERPAMGAAGRRAWTLVAGVGLAAGALSGFFGIGGGFLIVPGLTFSAGLSTELAIGTSLLSVAAFGFTTAVQYALAGKVDWLIALFYVVGGLLGGFLGERTGRGLGNALLTKLFSIVVVLVAAYIVATSLRLIR